MKSTSTRNLNNRQPQVKNGSLPTRVMTADKPQTFLLRGNKKRPETAKPKKPQDLKTNEAQDHGVNLQKVLQYYRDRVQAHEQDRMQYQAKLEKLRIKQTECHKTEWELKKRTEERQELGDALMQCQQQLGGERGTIEEMKEGGDALRLKSSQNKQQILGLLESSNSVEQHVYYQKGENPEKIQQYYLSSKGNEILGGKATLAPTIKPNYEDVKSTLSFRQPKKPNVLRTIYMPNFEVDQAQEEVEGIKGEISQEQEFYKNIMKGLQDEKAAFEEAQRARYMALKDQYDNAIKEMQAKEAYNVAIVKDHLELKHIFELEERAQSEENESIRQQNQMLRNSIRGICSNVDEIVGGAKNDYEVNAEEFSVQFRDQSQKQNENMSIIRDQYNKLQSIYKRKMLTMQEKLEKDSTRLTQQNGKRKLDLEGFNSDLQNLEKRMVFYQNYIGKLKKLVDRDTVPERSASRQNMFGMDQEVILEQIAEEE